MNYYRFQLKLAIIRVKSRLGLDWRPKRLKTAPKVDYHTLPFNEFKAFSDADVYLNEWSDCNPVWYHENN